MYDKLKLRSQLLHQLAALFVAFTVLFPILWIVSLSLDPRDIARPTTLHLIPPGASLDAYRQVLKQPTANPVTFTELALNQLRLATGVALFSVLIGVLAAYSFSRFKYRGRKALMLVVLTVLIFPSTVMILPLYVLLNRVQINLTDLQFNLRNSLWGVMLAVTSYQLPIAIWNLKGYLDAIPRELEEAALLDGASPTQVFLHIVLPMSRPALAVTAFLGFKVGWAEFPISWMFLSNPQDFTLSMSLYNMTGRFSGDIPWSAFAAMSLIIAAPVGIVYLLLQKHIVSGLTLGSIR